MRNRFKRALKKTIKLLVFLFYLPIIFLINIFSHRVRSKTLLVVKIDAIGDYLLFRDSLRVLHESPEYNDYKIVFCGNSAVRDLAESFDKRFVDGFIWVDKKKFLKNFFYTVKLFVVLNKLGSAVTIQTTFSRDFGDLLVLASSATHRYVASGDAVNVGWLQKNIVNIFCRVIFQTKNILFESLRTEDFLKQFLQRDIQLLKPVILPELKNKDLVGLRFHGEKYALVFPGALRKDKMWEWGNFLKISEYLQEKYKLSVFVCGGVEVASLAGSMCIYPWMKNLVGKTNLSDLVSLVSGAALVVSNESMAVHLAACVGTKFVCVAADISAYGRFFPYPTENVVSGSYVLPKDFNSSRKIVSVADITILEVEKAVDDLLI